MPQSLSQSDGLHIKYVTQTARSGGMSAAWVERKHNVSQGRIDYC